MLAWELCTSALGALAEKMLQGLRRLRPRRHRRRASTISDDGELCHAVLLARGGRPSKGTRRPSLPPVLAALALTLTGKLSGRSIMLLPAWQELSSCWEGYGGRARHRR